MAGYGRNCDETGYLRSLKRRQFLAGSAAFVGLVPFMGRALGKADDAVGGEYYDWQKTMRPEKPWLHDYSQMLQMGLFLCQRDGAGRVKKVYHTFEDALEVIRKIDSLTLGIPKIMNLVGWQFNGHDSCYPSWSVVNERLKRPQDKTAVDSLRWLLEAGRQYHTIVSLHINMFDAYKDSPLWATYDRSNIIIKNLSGQPIEGPIYDGMQSYQISYAQEWKLGLAQKRIDGLLRMLPELKQAGVIHIDAFKTIQAARPSEPLSSPYLGYKIEDELAAQRKILRYWRMNGVDVTTEYAANTIDPDPFVGLQIMSNCIDLEGMLTYDWLHKPANFLGFPPNLFPAPPCHEESPTKGDPEEIHFERILKMFCMRALPWYYHNNSAPKEEGFSFSPDYFDDVFLPALWLPSTIVAYSTYGNWQINKWEKVAAPRTWRLPKSWHAISQVKVSKITIDGLKPLYALPVTDGTIKLRLKAGEAVAIQAVQLGNGAPGAHP